MPSQRQVTDKPEDCPTAWFVVLERARRTDDYELAARATQELRRLGVDVRFRRPRPERTGVANG